METKYTVKFINSDGSHNSRRTMDKDEYIEFLEKVTVRLTNGDTTPTEDIPTIEFSVEERSHRHSTVVK